MVEIAKGTEVYSSNKYLKQLLLKRYGNELFFSEMPGLSDVVCFKSVATSAVNDIHKAKSREIRDERPIQQEQKQQQQQQQQQ